MREPKFLGLDEVLDIHDNQLQEYGGSAGVRDLGLLEAALATPAATFDGKFLHGTLCEMASAYLFHLALNHPFVDGNKRTALMATIVFLGLNGQELTAPPDKLLELVLAVTERKASKAQAAVFFEENTTG